MYIYIYIYLLYTHTHTHTRITHIIRIIHIMPDFSEEVAPSQRLGRWALSPETVLGREADRRLSDDHDRVGAAPPKSVHVRVSLSLQQPTFQKFTKTSQRVRHSLSY